MMKEEFWYRNYSLKNTLVNEATVNNVPLDHKKIIAKQNIRFNHEFDTFKYCFLYEST